MLFTSEWLHFFSTFFFCCLKVLEEGFLLNSFYLDFVLYFCRPFAPDEVDLERDETDNVIPDSVPVGGGLLRIHVHSGEGLEGKRHSNPFVVVSFRGVEQKTRVCGPH